MIRVGGTVTIEGDSKGDSISVGGTLKAEGDLELTGKLKVGGTVSCDGNIVGDEISVGGEHKAASTKANYFKIGRRGTVIGPVQADKIIISTRATAENLYGGEIILEERSRAKNVYGDSIYSRSR